MCYIDGQKNKNSVLNECNRMLKYKNINEFYKYKYIYIYIHVRIGFAYGTQYAKLARVSVMLWGTR
jgi:hypothetical protein